MAETYTPHYNWTKPSLGGDANTWGSVLNGTIDKIDAQVWGLNTQLQPNYMAIARGPDGGVDGVLAFTNYGNTQPRWQLWESTETESGGGNVGSNFGLNACDDSGNYLGTAFTIARATQVVTFTQSVTVNVNLTVDGGINCASFWNNPTFSGAVTINNGLTTNAISCPTFYNNPTFTGNVYVNGAFAPNNVSVSNNLGVSGTSDLYGNTFCHNTLYISTAAGYGNNFLLNISGGFNTIQFSPQWCWTWQQSTGKLFYLSPTGYVFQLDGSGNLTIHGTLTQGSDVALKENIVAFDDDPLAVIKSIMPKRFTRKETPDQREIGFIAQDVQTALPEAVRAGDDGKLGIADMPLLAVLWSAVQKLTERVQELESRLAP